MGLNTDSAVGRTVQPLSVRLSKAAAAAIQRSMWRRVLLKGCVAKTSGSLVEVAKIRIVARPTHPVHELQAPLQVASF